MKTGYKRYHIETKEVPPKIKIPSEFRVKRYNNCLNVQECWQACIYGVHEIQEDGQIAEPTDDLCRGCYLCFLTCPKNAISIEVNSEFKQIGNSYFTPNRIKTIHFEAETGRVPVSGTGYRGPFAGTGFDSIWFDFSEIVRPTRDGIHGREYISTSVILGRKRPYLEFDEEGNILSNISNNVEIPIPMIFDPPLPFSTEKNLQLALAKAAFKLGTFAILDAKEYSTDLFPFKSNLIPRICLNEIDEFEDLIKMSRIIEVAVKDEELNNHLKNIKTTNPSVLVSVYLPYDEKACDRAETVAKFGGDIFHLYVNDEDVERDPDIIKKGIYSIHSYLVEKNIRNNITIISSGGIAEASHVPKSIILGADAVAVGLAYQIALGCKVCYGNAHEGACYIEVEDGEVEDATQRIMNLMGSWRDQLLEVLGGMGLREVRRQRGEIGRAMFYEELEAKIFGGQE